MHDGEHKGEKEEEKKFSRGAMKLLVGCRREEENPTRVRSWVENCGIVKFIEFRCKCVFFFATRGSCLKDGEWRQRQEVALGKSQGMQVITMQVGKALDGYQLVGRYMWMLG